MSTDHAEPGSEIAVVGMALRFPGAATPVAFWDNLCAGVESITELSDAQLRAAGVPEALLEHPSYVRRKPLLSDVAPFEEMDLRLFRFSPREAQLTGPEQRLLLECAWEALESAGIGVTPPGVRGGVFVSSDLSRYLLRNLMPAMTSRTLATVMEQAMFGNDRDHTALRLAHRLDLTGPAFALGSTCSSSLLAVHLACQSLLHFECDYAVAGGASVEVPHATGYLYRDGGLASPDGHCRAFDARANGTVFGSGAGIVVLARLDDAVADGHRIYATVRASAVNNDGAHKQSYTSPSVDGQAKVIAEALALADLDPAAIGVIEAQGTATPLGDSIEVAAMHQAFGGRSRGSRTCALGSVKTNIGHAGGAAGIAAFIKAALMVSHGRVLPGLHFESPNPSIDFERGPFYVATEEALWPNQEGLRFAGVSAFGIGGTNVHVILAEAPAPVPSEPASGPYELVWSAATTGALEGRGAQLRGYLEAEADLDLADLAWTLKNGRRHLAHRDALVCRDRDDALRLLADPGLRRQSQAKSGILVPWLRGELVEWPGADRRRLVLPAYPFTRERQWVDPPQSGGAGAPRPEPETLEEIITDAALSVLGFYADGISPEADLIAWGIDSFLAAELIQNLHQRLGVTIPIAMLYEHRTVRALAAQLDGVVQSRNVPPSFDFEWVADRATLAQIHDRMAELPATELGAIEPLFGDGKLVDIEHLQARWQRGELVVLCARPAGSAEVAGLYLLDRREAIHFVAPRGIARLDDIFVSYSFLAPASRGQLNVSLLDQWFDEQAALRWHTAPADIANTVRFRTSICHKHGRIVAAALARGPHEQEPLFERIYFQNFDATEQLERLSRDPKAQGRLLALMRSQDYGGILGEELLALVDAPTARAFAGLEELIPDDARPRLRDAQRRVERGELSFVGYELRWLEPFFVWRRPG